MGCPLPRHRELLLSLMEGYYNSAKFSSVSEIVLVVQWNGTSSEIVLVIQWNGTSSTVAKLYRARAILARVVEWRPVQSTTETTSHSPVNRLFVQLSPFWGDFRRVSPNWRKIPKSLPPWAWFLLSLHYRRSSSYDNFRAQWANQLLVVTQ